MCLFSTSTKTLLMKLSSKQSKYALSFILCLDFRILGPFTNWHTTAYDFKGFIGSQAR
jgi:hypothetical protein